jgi:hypothetical protein
MPQMPKCNTMTKTLSKTKYSNVGQSSQLMLDNVKGCAAKGIFHDSKAAIFGKVHT